MPGIRKSQKPVLAIDLGGTKIFTAVVSPDGQVIAKEKSPTSADEGPQAVINRLFLAIDHILNISKMELSQLHSISLAPAGPIHLAKGLVTASPNLPGWQDVPLRDIVKDKYKINTFLLNDAKAAAFGEHTFGAGKGVHNLLYLTVSTGIGGGIIINDCLYQGTTGSAGEMGHMTIEVNGPKCNCGNTGCLEMLASGTAIAREAKKRISGGEKSSVFDMVAGEIEDITAETVGLAAQKGDPLALAVITQAATYLGVGMASLVNIFNPEMIVVGGGVAKLGDLLLEPARQEVQARAFRVSAQAVRIVRAQLGDEAGVLGAAAFALQQ